MNSDAQLAAIGEAIAVATGLTFAVRDSRAAGGGCIHHSNVLSDGTRQIFVKRNRPEALAMFQAEADGLAALAAASSDLCLPRVLAVGLAGGVAYLALDYLPLVALDRYSAARLGEALAKLHRQPAGEMFGWPSDNYIGSTPQSNAPHANWAIFYANQRLRPQLRLAAARGMERKLVESGERLAERVAAFFVDGQPQPSLLHGDLWSGNAAALPDGRPAIFDPAVYRGDREADLAMAELFGGFPEAFYAAYRATWPLAAGYETRKTLYNLYHILNHFNLFGASYLGQVRRMIERLLAELG